MNVYDYVIVGAGPAGLTLAWYLAKYCLGKKILIVERENTLGGCHRVRRVDGLFAEHGPRIIGSNFFCLINILKDLGVEFDEMYIPTNYSVTSRVLNILQIISIREFMVLVMEQIKFLLRSNNDHLRQITMKEFVTHHNFSKEAMSFIDMLCRITDGADMMSYTLWEFLQLPNQLFFYSICEPRVPNDVGLFKIWFDAMMKTGQIDIAFNTEIKSIHTTADKVDYLVDQSDQIIVGRESYIFAIPSKPMIKLLPQCPNPNLFGPIDKVIKWGTQAQYFPYLATIFHWDKKHTLTQRGSFPNSAYGVIYLEYATYFADPRSKTVVVCSATILDNVSPNNNKTAHQCSPEELLNEIYTQFKYFQPHLPEPTVSILSPDVYRMNDGLYGTRDSGFVLTPAGYKSSNSVLCSNLFWVGPHNGNSTYAFTSMESAMQNAIVLLHQLVPETKKTVLIQNMFTLRDFVMIIIILICLMLIIYVYKTSKT